VGLDHATKLLALGLLPRGRAVDWDAGFQVVLRVNESGSGTWSRALQEMSQASDAEMASTACTAYLALTVALIAVRRWKVRLRWKVLVCFGAYMLGAIGGEPFVPLLERLSVRELAILTRVAGAPLLLTVWWMVPRGLWKTTFALFLATALGNLISLLYPPFGVVDFVYSRYLWASVRLGVFNVADACNNVGLAFLAWAILRAVVRRLFGRRRRPAVDAGAGGPRAAQ